MRRARWLVTVRSATRLGFHIRLAVASGFWVVAAVPVGFHHSIGGSYGRLGRLEDRLPLVGCDRGPSLAEVGFLVVLGRDALRLALVDFTLPLPVVFTDLVDLRGQFLLAGG